MYDPKTEYKQYKGKNEIEYRLPEWFRILKESYFKIAYNNDSLDETSFKKTFSQKNKKKGVDNLL